mgnify:CR=1 FL=1
MGRCHHTDTVLGRIAQWSERSAHNGLVAGSIPAAPTIPYFLILLTLFWSLVLSYYRDFREVRRGVHWTVWAIIPTIILFCAIGYAYNWFGEGFQVAREEFGPRAAIFKYEWFHDKHENIKSVKQKVKIAQDAVKAFTDSAGPRSSWTFEDKNEMSRLSAVLNATQNILTEMVSEYNSNSSKFNHKVFRDAQLPVEQTTDIGD